MNYMKDKESYVKYILSGIGKRCDFMAFLKGKEW